MTVYPKMQKNIQFFSPRATLLPALIWQDECQGRSEYN